MVSKKWQKKQPVIQHVTLGIAWGFPLFLAHVDMPLPQKVGLIVMILLAVIPAGIYLNRRLAATMVKVFQHQEEAVAGVVQRSLTKNYIRFSRRYQADETHFVIRDKGLTLVIEAYPLNLPIDSHIEPTDATKVEIRGLNKSNSDLAERISTFINQSADLRFSQA